KTPVWISLRVGKRARACPRLAATTHALAAAARSTSTATASWSKVHGPKAKSQKPKVKSQKPKVKSQKTKAKSQKRTNRPALQGGFALRGRMRNVEARKSGVPPSGKASRAARRANLLTQATPHEVEPRFLVKRNSATGY